VTNHKVYKSSREPNAIRKQKYITGRPWETIGIHLQTANRTKEHRKKTIGRAHRKTIGSQLNT
jgi:hypothetical protein